jgi:hypothetical protein
MADVTIPGLPGLTDNQVIGSLVLPSSVSNSTYKLTLNQISNYVIQNQGLICDVLIVAGGGGANNAICGGGGGGGVLYLENYAIASGQTINVTIGAGGRAGTTALGPDTALNGDNSKFNDMVAIGGGAGGQSYNGFGKFGGCGGGGSRSNGPGNQVYFGGACTPGQGYPGGTGSNSGAQDNYGSGAGGGGAGGAGYNASGSYSGHGGPGYVCTIDGTLLAYGGGGGGGSYNHYPGTGGQGGGGNGSPNSGSNGGNGTDGLGGGGGGGGYLNGASSSGGKGGSGIVIVRYKGAQVATGGQSVSTYAINGITYTVHKYTTTGNSTFVVP